MNTKNKNNSLFQKDQLKASLKQSFVKLNPRLMVKNPIMFTVEIATFFMLPVTVYSAVSDAQGSVIYNFSVFVILFLTLLFANFAEAIAEARGKAQADSLRKTREETPAKRVTGGKLESVSSSQLKKGDVFECEAGDVIPADGEIIEGLASIDESAITGESAPVIREAGGDKSSVTGGTKVLSDRIRVVVTTQPGESFLDKMIALVEGASRQKTPNEIALTILLAVFTLVFLVVCITLKPMADYSGTTITIAAFLSLFVCLIPILPPSADCFPPSELQVWTAHCVPMSSPNPEKPLRQQEMWIHFYWTRRVPSLSETVRLQPFIRSKRFLCTVLWKYACSLP